MVEKALGESVALRPRWKARKAGVWCQRAMAAAVPCVLTQQEEANAGRRHRCSSQKAGLPSP